MTETVESIRINTWLFSNFPAAHGSNNPLFRVVWSEDMLERRRGTFTHFYTVTLPDGRKVKYRGEHTGVETVKKYNYIKDCWILEQWAPPELVNTEELPDSKDGGYEPLYVFRDSKFQPLPLNLRVVQIIVSRAVGPKVSPTERASLNREEEIRREAAEQAYLEEALDLSATQSLLHHGEAIIVPHTYGEKND